MNYFKRFLPMLILIPISLYIVAFVFQFAIGSHIIKEYYISVGNYNTKILIFEFWNREGNGYLNNLQYVFEEFIESITNMFTEVPIIKKPQINLTNIGPSLLYVFMQTFNILACIINVLVFLPFKLLWGIIIFIFGILGIDFTNTNNVAVVNFLWVLSDFQIPYLQ